MVGESLSGDGFRVRLDGASAWIAVSDGLGHGSDARAASDAILATVDQTAPRNLQTMVKDAHEAARRTRGAALSVVHLDAARRGVHWITVGNIETVLVRRAPGAGAPRERPVARGGVVGYRLPALLPAYIDLHDGDLLLLATDGLRTEFALEPGLVGDARPVDAICRDLFSTFHRPADDALLFVARFQRSVA